MADITNGITTSFSLTPQAKDDFYTSAMLSGLITEDGGTVTLDVMANDLGGKAKTLYSLDDGIENEGSATTADLLVKDIVGADNFSQFGALIEFTADGKVSYTMNSASTAHFQSLAAGEIGLDTFTYAIRLSNGALSSATVTVQVIGTNDAAVITGTTTTSLTETDVAQSTGGTLVATDIDSSNTFIAQTDVAGNNGYGKFSIDAGGVWTYTMGDSHNEFVGGITYTDSVTVATADGTTQVLTVNMLGTNDATTFTGDDTKGLTETDAALTTGGTLQAHDVDSAQTFQVQNNVAGSNAYGHFTIGTNGEWTYAMDTAHNEFQAGTTYTDTLTVQSADGTEHTLTVNMLGTNDAATFTGDDTKGLTETDAALITGGTLVAHDVDSAQAFLAQDNVTGSNAYGHFTIDTDGVWTYAMDTAHNEFQAGTTYIDTLTVQSADGTEHTLTVNMLGTDDATVITGASTIELTETNAAQSTGGALVATDPDSSNAFVAQTDVASSNGYGKFSIDASGAWTYTMDTAHDEFASGTDYTDSFTVATADGTMKTIDVTIHGTNDAPVITTSGGAPIALSIAENTTSVVDINAMDTDNAVLTYSISGADAALFQVNPDTGVLSFASAPNYEVPLDAGGNNVYDLAMQVSDGLATDIQAIAVTVTDVAEGSATGPTGVKFALTTLQTSGNGLPSSGAVLGKFTAIDADGGTFSYTETADTVGGAAANTFSVNDINGDVTLNSALAMDKTYTLSVQVTDELLRTTSQTLVIQTGSSGIDTLNGDANINLQYGQNGNDILYGNEGNDTLLGGTNTNQLHGGAGADALYGNNGADTFYFDTALGLGGVSESAEKDAIYNFSGSGDTVWLSKTTFGALGTAGSAGGSALSSLDFVGVSGTGETASAGSAHIIYDSATGNLYYDLNGGDAVGRTLFATIDTATDSGTIDYNDIKVGL